VDETKDGTTAWFPPETASDAAYAAQTDSLVAAVWDFDDDGLPTIADLAIYRSVIWVSDDFNQTFEGQPRVHLHLIEAEQTLRDYLDLGGNVLLTGWEGASGTKRPLDYPIDLEPGDFLYDYFGLDVVDKEQQALLNGPVGEGSFPTIDLDPTRLRSTLNGNQIRGEYFTALRPGTDVAYRYDSDEPAAPYHLQPNGVARIGAGYRTIYWGFPLYHLQNADAHAALVAALAFLEDPGASDAPTIAAGGRWSLSASRPNPFSRETEVHFVVPGTSADVELAVYDLAGRRVRNLASGRIPGGLHARTWDGRNEDGRPVATGVYFYRLKAAETSLTRKVVLLR
jgi:hypothetical protein